MRRLLVLCVLLLVIPSVLSISVSVNKGKYLPGQQVEISVTECGGLSFLNVNRPDGQLVQMAQGFNDWQTNYNTNSDTSVGTYKIRASCGVDEVTQTFCLGSECPEPGPPTSTTSTPSGTGGGIPAGVDRGIDSCGRNFCKVTWGKIFAGEEANVVTRDLEITSVRFSAAVDISGVPRIQINSLQSMPRGVQEYPEAYARFNIVSRQLLEENMINPTIEFRVRKAWANSNGGKNVMTLLKLKERWVDLKATYLSEDTDYFYYSAKTDGFSYFAIAPLTATTPKVVPKKTVKTTPKKTTPRKTVPTPQRAPTPHVEPEVEEEEGFSSVLIGIIAAVALIAIGAIFFVMRKKPASPTPVE